ncbi:hypothetical protein D6833_13890 [Candidatus Parcubacteria bacterium]|nr:MAG: hypothetical protein D6833_13890 [Candidatus Parcubacteria bacterium]
MSIIRTLTEMVGDKNVITVHRAMVEFLEGNFEAALLFEQLLYWLPRSKQDGWVAKSAADWEKEIYLARHRLDKARRYLEKRGLIVVEKRKFAGAPTLHWRVVETELSRQWREFVKENDIETEPDEQDSANPFAENDKSICRKRQIHLQKSANPFAEISKSLTETTTEITPETTAEKKNNAGPPVDAILEKWKSLFPEKPQPRKTESLLRKMRARWRDPHFRENWELALEVAAESPTLHQSSWFDLRFFLRNDENYQKCLDRWMAWKDAQLAPKRPKSAAVIERMAMELMDEPEAASS